jgi:hypothetical protein
MQEKQLFLESFFKLFNAKIALLNCVSPNKYIGTLTWSDGESQDFSWIVPLQFEILSVSRKICDYIFENGLNRNDKLLISRENIVEQLSKLERLDGISVNNAIDFLLMPNIKMLDDGSETDSFFLHF